jgi:DNA-binding transcriptional regulator YiaG
MIGFGVFFVVVMMGFLWLGDLAKIVINLLKDQDEELPDGYFSEKYTTETTYYKPDPNDLREAFRIYRESHKMTQTEMCKMLGISRSAYSVFERGEDLKPSNMDRIIKFYWEKID